VRRQGAVFDRSLRRGGALDARAFSLIELLIVIAIISILASILLPGMNMARERARFAVCMNNLRQYGVGMYTFAMNNKDRFPIDVQQSNSSAGMVGVVPGNLGGNVGGWYDKWWGVVSTGSRWLAKPGKYLKDVNVLYCPNIPSRNGPTRLWGSDYQNAYNGGGYPALFCQYGNVLNRHASAKTPKIGYRYFLSSGDVVGSSLKQCRGRVKTGKMPLSPTDPPNCWMAADWYSGGGQERFGWVPHFPTDGMTGFIYNVLHNDGHVDDHMVFAWNWGYYGIKGDHMRATGTSNPIHMSRRTYDTETERRRAPSGELAW